MNKIFVTGSSGLLSTNIFLKKHLEYDFIGCIHKRSPQFKLDNLNFEKFNLFDRQKLKKILIKFNPNYILHNAAITNLELCEQNKELCFKINYELSCLITDVAKDLNIKLIFISTDQIYNGLKDSYSEKDTPNPINNYGISKVKSEEYILKHYSNSLIIRTNFFGWGPSYRNSFSDRVLKDTFTNVKELDDVSFNPIYLSTLIKILFEMINNNYSGLFNLSSDDSFTKYKLAKKFLEYFKINKNIKRIYLKDLPQNLARPTCMILENNKIKNQLGISKIDTNNCLYNLKLDFDNGYAKQIQQIT